MSGRGVRSAFYQFEANLREQTELPGEYALQQFTPRLFRLGHPDNPASPPLAMAIFWYLFSSARYHVFYVVFEGRIVHSSYLLWRNPRLAFMKRGDVHIGPCWTDPQHRGRRLFPAVISRIAALHSGRRVWMIADEDNLASRNGIERAGFRLVGFGRKIAGRYTIDSPGSA